MKNRGVRARLQEERQKRENREGRETEDKVGATLSLTSSEELRPHHGVKRVKDEAHVGIESKQRTRGGALSWQRRKESRFMCAYVDRGSRTSRLCQVELKMVILQL